MNASEFSVGAAHELVITAARAGWELSDFTTLTQSEDRCRQVCAFLRGEADLVAKIKPTPQPEVVIDPMVRVDRSVRPSYPSWMKKVMHPELENSGPSEYSGEGVVLWLHDDQKSGWVNGNKIYTALKEGGDLESCLGLRDLEEIQKKGPAFFRKYFKGKVLVGWRSVVQDGDGGLRVPCLYEDDGMVFLFWRSVVIDFYSGDPAARFAS